MAIVMRRLGAGGAGDPAAADGAIALSRGTCPRCSSFAAGSGALIWYVFLASLLMLVPFLSRSQQVMREFALLAGISTVATSLDLLFVAVFSLGQFTSLTLALFLALGLYAGARQWMLNQLMGSNMLTTERMFEQLYRIAREVETAGGDTHRALRAAAARAVRAARGRARRRARRRARAWSATARRMLVPLPRVPGVPERATQPRGSLVLRFARRGRRLFTREDARLTDRVRRAAACAPWPSTGGRARPQRGARAHRAGPARRHRRAPADADVQGADPRDGGLRPPHAAGPEDADARAGGARRTCCRTPAPSGRPTSRSASTPRTASSTGRSTSTATSSSRWCSGRR